MSDNASPPACRLCVLGAAGRMGAMVIAEAEAMDGVHIVAATEHAGHASVGAEVAGGVAIVADLAAALASADAYVDFTIPASTAAAARAAVASRTAAVVGTTGLDGDAEAALDALAVVAPIVVAPNFSLGVNVLLILAEQAARALGPSFDLEVVEAHHRHKRDAPSGTALALGRALARGRGAAFDDVKRLSREGDVGPRRPGEIGLSTVRGGDVIGEHTAFFFGANERVELTHRAGSRAIFATGALHAARWVVGRPPGRYTMRDVLGL